MVCAIEQVLTRVSVCMYAGAVMSVVSLQSEGYDYGMALGFDTVGGVLLAGECVCVT